MQLSKRMKRLLGLFSSLESLRSIKPVSFSELNNISDISLSPEYGTLLGYTHSEVKAYFADYLVQSATIVKKEEEALC